MSDFNPNSSLQTIKTKRHIFVLYLLCFVNLAIGINYAIDHGYLELATSSVVRVIEQPVNEKSDYTPKKVLEYIPDKAYSLAQIEDISTEDENLIEILLPEGEVNILKDNNSYTFTYENKNYVYTQFENQKIVMSPEGGINRQNGMSIIINDTSNTCQKTFDTISPDNSVRIVGTNTNDQIIVTQIAVPITIEGLSGDDIIDITQAKCHSNWIDGGWGNDTITGSNFDDHLSGGFHRYEEINNKLLPIEGCIEEGNDSEIFDTIYGNDGDDMIIGCYGNDTLSGGDGDDTVYGDGTFFTNEEVSYPHTNDTIYGNQGDDFLHGGPGDDIIKGQSGNDTLRGGKGINDLDGGSGENYIEE